MTDAEERKQLARLQLLVLERLRQGRASFRELNEISTRFGSRIGELRKRGYVIRTIRKYQSGADYELISEPEEG